MTLKVITAIKWLIYRQNETRKTLYRLQKSALIAYAIEWKIIHTQFSTLSIRRPVFVYLCAPIVFVNYQRQAKITQIRHGTLFPYLNISVEQISNILCWLDEKSVKLELLVVGDDGLDWII